MESFALLIAATLIIGAWLGALTANRLPAPVLRLLFGVLVVVLGGIGCFAAATRTQESPTAGTSPDAVAPNPPIPPSTPTRARRS